MVAARDNASSQCETYEMFGVSGNTLRRRSPSPYPLGTIPVAASDTLGVRRTTSEPSEPTPTAQDLNNYPVEMEQPMNAAIPAHIISGPSHTYADPCGTVPSSSSRQRQEITFVPVSPCTLANWRYRSRSLLPDESERMTGKLRPMQVNFTRAPPRGWIALAHPEGQLYFVREGKIIFTEQNLYDTVIFDGITDCVKELERRMARRLDIPSDVEVAIYFGCDDNGAKCAWYYFASERHLAICWLEEVDFSLVTPDNRFVYSKSQLKNPQEAQFWAHRELYPGLSKIPRAVLQELYQDLLYLAHDARTSLTSTAPCNAGSLNANLELVHGLKERDCSGPPVCAIARIMHTLARERTLHHHGELCARLNRDQSVFEDLEKRPSQRSYLFLIIQLPCFYLPDGYASEVEQVWVDGLVNYDPWNNFISRLKQDWETLALPATVLLTVNVGLLAVQSIDEGSPHRNVAQIMSYCSIIHSLSSIVMCMILSRQHRTNGVSEDMESATEWLSRNAGTPWDVEKLASVLSLPNVLFIWGLIDFCIAMLWICFYNTSWLTRVVVGVVLIPNIVLVAWVILMGWRCKDPAACLSQRLRDAFRERWQERFQLILYYFWHPQFSGLFPWPRRASSNNQRPGELPV